MSTDLDAAPAEAPAAPVDSGYRSLDPKVVLLDRIAGLIFTAVVFGAGGISLLVTWFTADEAWLPMLVAVGWPLVTALLAWHSWRWPAIDYRYQSYRVADIGIEIRRGVFWRRVITVPRSRVQHIDVSQGPLERRFGLGRLAIYTAGTEYAMVSLGGVTYETAVWIRDRLLPQGLQDVV